MSRKMWTQSEIALLQNLISKNKSHKEMAREIAIRAQMNTPGFPVVRTLKAVSRKIENGLGFDVNDSVQARWEAIEEIQQEYLEESQVNTTGVLPAGQASRKILSLSDIHFPLARTDLLESIIEEHSDASIIVLNGDILEGYAFSMFEKEKTIAALDEYNAAFDFVHMLSEKFDNVVLVGGNHDIRASRSLKSSGHDKAASQILRPDLLARIANGERLDGTGMLIEKLDFSNVHYQARESWYVKIGKTIFMHPHGRGSERPGHTVMRFGERLMQRYQAGEIDSVVCGHTHKVYKGIRNGVMYIEQGYLAGVLAYLHSPKSDYRYNYQNGYAVIYQDDQGNTDFNLSGPIYLGESHPPKKSLNL